MPGWNQVSSFCSSTKPENLRFYLKDAVQESELEWCISLQSLQFIFNLKFVQSCSFKFDKASFFCGIIHHTSAEMVFLLLAELRALKPELCSLLSPLFRTTEEAAAEEQHFSSCWECLNLCNVQKLSEKAQAAASVWWAQIIISFAKYPSRNKHLIFTIKINIQCTSQQLHSPLQAS